MFAPIPDVKSCIGSSFLGVFQLGIAYLLYTIAIKKVTALDAIMLSCIEPVSNPIWIFLVIVEKPGSWAIVGGMIILVCTIVRSVPF